MNVLKLVERTYLHDKLRLTTVISHEIENVEVDGSTQIVNVGEEAVFLSIADELGKKTRIVKGFVEVSVACVGVLVSQSIS